MVFGVIKKAIEKYREKQRVRKFKDWIDQWYQDTVEFEARVIEYRKKGFSKEEAEKLAERDLLRIRKARREKSKQKQHPLMQLFRFFAPPEVVVERRRKEAQRQIKRKKRELLKNREGKKSIIWENSGPKWLFESSGVSKLLLESSGGPSWLFEDHDWTSGKRRRK